jgi:hypothetical protein
MLDKAEVGSQHRAASRWRVDDAIKGGGLRFVNLSYRLPPPRSSPSLLDIRR